MKQQIVALRGPWPLACGLDLARFRHLSGGCMFAMSEVADFLCGGVLLVLVLFFASLD